MSYIIFGSPLIGEEEIEEVVAVLRSGWLGTGPRVAAFEKAFAQYKGVPSERVAALNSCTAGLHVSMIAAGIGRGDEVITTALTFCATVNAIIHAGATPVLVDVDPKTMNIDPSQIEGKISPRTRAIVPVHFAGRPCSMGEILVLAEKHNLKVIEDCAHAIETEWHGRKSGTMGNFGCFSFYATKNICTGEGGMVIARTEEDIARIKMLSLHGLSKDAWHRFSDAGYKHYYVVECGYKYNMMDIQAAIGLHQLNRLERNWQRRLQVWNWYQQQFADLPVERPQPFEKETRHGLHLYTLLIDEKRCGISRDDFMVRLHKAGIGTGVHYLSLPEHPYYQRTFGWRPEQYPQAMRIGRQTVSLPLSAKLTDSQVEYITDTVRKIFQ